MKGFPWDIHYFMWHTIYLFHATINWISGSARYCFVSPLAVVSSFFFILKLQWVWRLITLDLLVIYLWCYTLLESLVYFEFNQIKNFPKFCNAWRHRPETWGVLKRKSQDFLLILKEYQTRRRHMIDFLSKEITYKKHVCFDYIFIWLIYI